jgi:hypothetical protein
MQNSSLVTISLVKVLKVLRRKEPMAPVFQNNVRTIGGVHERTDKELAGLNRLFDWVFNSLITMAMNQN